ncbi:PIN domain-containing protein [Vibrio alginolyticus]|uniref:PIN domain-containing protein n=1 Tax=Vibrio alginolyticus TaxID=663 RepID=UPI00215B78A1|nr:PIN domain-containing protein [Vibrio alginolyticus]MCR9586563.1 PIN domain-containing protein [Vibrio alginolyticus]
MELETRLVFVDTSAYESKNFQFGQHALGRLQELVEEERIHLLITDVTRKEIETHLKKKSEDAASKIKKLTKDAMFLRNTPELDCHGIFTKLSSAEIYEVVHAKFLQLIDNGLVENVQVSSVDSSIVFDAYFKNLPPFNNESKKHEFPDAFALEAVKNLSSERRHSAYIVSSDSDMKSFCEQEENLLHLGSIDDLIDLVVRSDKAFEEPSKFADEVFELLEDDIRNAALEALEEGDFIYEHAEPFEDTISSVDINTLVISKKNLLDVSAEWAEYEIEFDITAKVEYRISDYDRSPWDPEDKQYVFVLKNESTAIHKETYTAHLSLEYADGLKANSSIHELNFEESYFELTDTDCEVIHFRELDINGE